MEVDVADMLDKFKLNQVDRFWFTLLSWKITSKVRWDNKSFAVGPRPS